MTLELKPKKGLETALELAVQPTECLSHYILILFNSVGVTQGGFLLLRVRLFEAVCSRLGFQKGTFVI